MGVIVNELRQLLDRHLTDHGIVLWFDPEQHYERTLEGLAIPGSKVLRFERSFYELRDEAEPLLRGMEVPVALVYLPVEYETARMPLAELISYGTIVRPGEKGLANTRLAVVARRALRGLVPETRLDRLDKEIEQNKLTLAELEDLALGGGEMHLPTVLGVIYDAQHVAAPNMGFLSRSDCERRTRRRNCLHGINGDASTEFWSPGDIWHAAGRDAKHARPTCSQRRISCRPRRSDTGELQSRWDTQRARGRRALCRTLAGLAQPVGSRDAT